VGQDFCDTLSLCHGSVLHVPEFSRPNYRTSISRRKMETKKETFKKRSRHKINITEKQADNIADNLVSYNNKNNNYTI
jgi:hypothetical protein